MITSDRPLKLTFCGSLAGLRFRAPLPLNVFRIPVRRHSAREPHLHILSQLIKLCPRQPLVVIEDPQGLAHHLARRGVLTRSDFPVDEIIVWRNIDLHAAMILSLDPSVELPS